MRFFSCAFGVATLAYATSAHAGAWTQEAGHGQIITTGLYYQTDEKFDNSGHRQSQSTYSKYELNPYAEYGLKDDITLGTNLSFQRAHQDGVPSQTNWGIGDSEFFLRARLWNKNNFVISAEPMIKLPSPESGSDTPRLGGSHPDLGMGLSAGYGFSAWGNNHFADIDTQYRHRFGSPKDQIKICGTVGFGITSRLMLMPQAFLTYRTESPSVVTFTESPADDYNLIKLQLSAVYKLRDDVALQVGAFDHVDGKNVGAGGGGLISLWKSF